MTTFTEKLQNLANKVCLMSDGHTPSGCGTGCEIDTVELMVEAIKRLILEEMPKKDSKFHLREDWYQAGWDDYRTELMKKLEINE